MGTRARTYDPGSVRAITGLMVFIVSFLWFYYPGEYVLIANQDLTLFRATGGYLISFMNRPGGLLEVLGSFLSQFFRFRFTGALLLAGIITASLYVTYLLVSKISNRRELFIMGALTPILFLGMHNFYPHQVYYSLGFLLAIGLAAAFRGTGIRRWVFLLITVPVVYIVGGGYLWIFCGLILAGDLIKRRKVDPRIMSLTVLYPALVVIVGAKFIFLDPLKELAVIQLPFGQGYGSSPWPGLLTGWLFLYMILAGIPDPLKKMRPLWRTLAGTTVCLAVTVVVIQTSYNRKNAEFFHIEKMAVDEDWDGVLQYTARHPSTNLFGSFYTNMALANTGRLCKDLFLYPQPFGRRGLCFEWDTRREILRRGGDFYWTVSLVNEAHHWAFESMIVDGFTRRNLTRLIETELVRGNDKVAEKYIDLLSSSLFQYRLAEHYRQFLNNRHAVENDPDLGPRMRYHLINDFFPEGSDLETNLRMLLDGNSSNRPAFDYLMALLLLEKNVDGIAELLPAYFATFKGTLPELLGESLMVYKITHKEDQLSHMEVSASTIRKFDAYTRILRQYQDLNDAARILHPSYGNSFWFYLNFSSLTGGRP